MQTLIEELEYGEEKVVKFRGKYRETLARAVDAGKPVANAELLLMSDDSNEENEVRLIYCENRGMSEYIFFEMNEYINNNKNLIDILQFNYLKDGMNKTGVVIVVRAETTICELAKEFK